MTYAELLALLNTLSPEQLNQSVTVYDSGTDEYTGAIKAFITDEDVDVVDEGHLVISF